MADISRTTGKMKNMYFRFLGWTVPLSILCSPIVNWGGVLVCKGQSYYSEIYVKHTHIRAHTQWKHGHSACAQSRLGAGYTPFQKMCTRPVHTSYERHLTIQNMLIDPKEKNSTHARLLMQDPTHMQGLTHIHTSAIWQKLVIVKVRISPSFTSCFYLPFSIGIFLPVKDT